MIVGSCGDHNQNWLVSLSGSDAPQAAQAGDNVSDDPSAIDPPFDGASHHGWLAGHCLIAMPDMKDPRFARVVILICIHDENGAMGLIINRQHQDLSFADLCTKLDIAQNETVHRVSANYPILEGGPVDCGRGFVVQRIGEPHSPSTLKICDDVLLSATVHTIETMAKGHLINARVALGYAGWSAGQLEREMRDNAWLTCPADAALLFDHALDEIYDVALARLGINSSALHSSGGEA